MGEEKLGQCPPRVYVVPVHERYRIVPTSDTRYYIYDYVKYTTVTDEDGMTRMFDNNRDAYQAYDKLVADYQKEYHKLIEAAEKRARGES